MSSAPVLLDAFPHGTHGVILNIRWNQVCERRTVSFPVDSWYRRTQIPRLPHPLRKQPNSHLPHRPPLTGGLFLHLSVKLVRYLNRRFYGYSLLYFLDVVEISGRRTLGARVSRPNLPCVIVLVIRSFLSTQTFDFITFHSVSSRNSKPKLNLLSPI